MSLAKNHSPLNDLTEQAVEAVCIGQIAALAALRAEMTGLSTMMTGLSRTLPNSQVRGLCGLAAVAAPDDSAFDNMPV